MSLCRTLRLSGFKVPVESTSKCKISQSFYKTLVWCWKLEFFTSNLGHKVPKRSRKVISSFIAKGREFIPAFTLYYLEQNWLSGSYSDNTQFGALLSYNIRVPFSHSSIVILAVSEWILLPLAILCNICIALRSKIGKRYVAVHMRTPTDSLSRSLDNCLRLFVSFK